MWWIYVLVGLICGFVDSVLGMGYGVSAATVLVSFGLEPALVSASIHTAEGFVDIVSGLSHWKFDNVDKTLFLHLMIPGVAGAVIGALFLSWISAAFAKKFVAVLLFMMGL
ncbi:MAG: sulfite exporter TauE/SafE family protein, partial [Candidatus Methanospirareceae archaeon]